MRRAFWFVHPIFIFIFSIIALGLSLFLYIYWYVEVSSGLKAVLEKTNLDPQQFVAWQTWVVIMIMSILVGIILIGIFMIFVYQRKTLALYRSQHTFINSFTHELKTPTTSLRLYLETFLKHELPRDKQLKYLGYMLADVERLSENVNGILNLARLEAKIFGGEFVVVDLAEKVKDFCAENAQLFRGADIQIQNKEDVCYYCSINLSLFHMLLMNILSNGIQYNKSDRPRIIIRLSQTDKNILVDFIDNGIGFEKSSVKKIFRKFYQIERADWSQSGGTGLGLYMVEQVVKFHKGKISAESEGLGKGARFTISLPVTIAKQEIFKIASEKL
ncbi:MAG: two-component system phosphate regulon sensor histidine kinase PhoR [Desulforhopalus sp.]|jgi:two-component system phosphate regulon sensor histidine kinase PhoR